MNCSWTTTSACSKNVYSVFKLMNNLVDSLQSECILSMSLVSHEIMCGIRYKSRMQIVRAETLYCMLWLFPAAFPTGIYFQCTVSKCHDEKHSSVANKYSCTVRRGVNSDATLRHFLKGRFSTEQIQLLLLQSPITAHFICNKRKTCAITEERCWLGE